jgi:hypothetical protein
MYTDTKMRLSWSAKVLRIHRFLSGCTVWKNPDPYPDLYKYDPNVYLQLLLLNIVSESLFIHIRNRNIVGNFRAKKYPCL